MPRRPAATYATPSNRETGLRPYEPIPSRLSATSFLQRNGYILRKMLGRGTHGVVVQAFSLKKGKTVAIKIVHKKEIPSDQPTIAEVISMRKVQGHPNVVQLYEVEKMEDLVFIVMQLAEGGSLYKYIMENDPVSEIKIKSLFRDLITGLKHCHDNHVVHSDITSGNLLLDQNGRLVICDFGNSRIHNDDELLRMRANSTHDIWNSGVVLFTMVYGFVPHSIYTFKSKPKLAPIMARGTELRPGVTAGCRDLICSILQVHPKDTLTIAEILEHPWVKERC